MMQQIDGYRSAFPEAVVCLQFVIIFLINFCINNALMPKKQKLKLPLN